MMARSRIGKGGEQRFVAGAAGGWVGDVLCPLEFFARGGNHFCNRTPLSFVTIEQRRVGAALANERQLPSEIERVLQAAIHAVPLRGRADMGRVARQQNATRSIAGGDFGVAMKASGMRDVVELELGQVAAEGR